MVPSDAVLETASNTARTIAGHAPIAVRLIRDGLRRSLALDLEESLRIETEGIKECLASADLREGVLAFTEKREIFVPCDELTATATCHQATPECVMSANTSATEVVPWSEANQLARGPRHRISDL